MIVSNKVKGRGCSVCANKQVVLGYNDLATTHPDLSSQLVDPSIAKTITSGSHRKLDWVCALGHVWSAALNSRITGRNCPYCGNKKVLQGYNDLATVRPDIASELFDDSVAATDVTFGSKKILKWKCLEGHTWVAAVHARCAGTGCPKCSDAGTSLIEKRLRVLINKSSLNSVSPDGPKKLDISTGRRNSMVIDYLVENGSKFIAIEYDGKYYHSSEESRTRDFLKTQALLDAGYSVVRIRESDLEWLDIQDDRLLQLNVDFKYSDHLLEDAVRQIEMWLADDR
jgi:very-short-patch-repair endonuclease